MLSDRRTENETATLDGEIFSQAEMWRMHKIQITLQWRSSWHTCMLESALKNNQNKPPTFTSYQRPGAINCPNPFRRWWCARECMQPNKTGIKWRRWQNFKAQNSTGNKKRWQQLELFFRYLLACTSPFEHVVPIRAQSHKHTDTECKKCDYLQKFTLFGNA